MVRGREKKGEGLVARGERRNGQGWVHAPQRGRAYFGVTRRVSSIVSARSGRAWGGVQGHVHASSWLLVTWLVVDNVWTCFLIWDKG